MKKIIIPILALTLLFCACQDKASENAADTPVENSAPGGERISAYDKDGLSFDIPESWRDNFKAVTREVGTSGNTYPQTDFYYTKDNRDILLMSVGKYTRDQWENLKKTGENVEDMLLGESGDKNHYYSIRYENHDYIDAGDEVKNVVEKIKKEAEALRDKIKIK